MLRLLCINNKPLVHSNGIRSTGDGLVEGKIYDADKEIYVHPNNKKQCYLILELSELKLVSRFIPLSDIDETEPVNSEESISILTGIV